MEKDFHYYLTYAAARTAQLPRHPTVAYACQFVDDNNEGQFTVDGSKLAFPQQLQAEGGEYYYPIMTQSCSPISLDPFVQKFVYVPFHFLPGDNENAPRGKSNPLNTTPNSNNARAVLRMALKTANPYQIGIALHTYADTWSHQGFTGLREDWNAVHPWYDVFKAMVPNIGHAEAGHSPDVISETWTDYRSKQKIDNRVRAFEALKELYGQVHGFTQAGPEWSAIETTFKGFITTDQYDDRIKAIVQYVKGTFGEDLPTYNKDTWINAALHQKGVETVMAANFRETDWYQFHQAAKIQLKNVVGLVAELL